jgi:hypothetical protein
MSGCCGGACVCKRAKDSTVTITISKSLATELATQWQPIDNEDNMIELFEACREVIKD